MKTLYSFIEDLVSLGAIGLFIATVLLWAAIYAGAI